MCAAHTTLQNVMYVLLQNRWQTLVVLLGCGRLLVVHVNAFSNIEHSAAIVAA